MRTAYDVLGVAPTATPQDIKKAYRALSLRFHPDTNPGDSRAESAFVEASEAYAILSDPVRRAAYDEQYLAPVGSIADLFGRVPEGKRVLQMLLPRAPAETRPGMDFVTVVNVDEAATDRSGPLRIGFTVNGSKEAVELHLPPEIGKTPCGVVPALGECGTNGGARGHLYVFLNVSNSRRSSGGKV